VFHPFSALGLRPTQETNPMAHALKSSRELRQRFDLYLNEAEIEQVRDIATAARLPMSGPVPLAPSGRCDILGSASPAPAGHFFQNGPPPQAGRRARPQRSEGKRTSA
jgi:hypothetical protein